MIMRRMKKKRWIMLLLVFALVLAPIQNSVYAFSTNEDLSEAQIVRFSASKNSLFNLDNGNMTRSVSNAFNGSSIDVEVATLSGSNQVTGTITLWINNQSFAVPIEGVVYAYDSVKGYVGVLNGFIVNEKDQAIKTPIVVDMSYISPTENLTAVTIGAMGEGIPCITFFGEYSDNLSLLVNTNTEIQLSMYNEKILNTESVYENQLQSIQPRIDATVRCQDSFTFTRSGYELGTLALFFPNELGNQNAMPVYAKVNSSSSGFIDYYEDQYGTGAGVSVIGAYADTYTVTLVGTDSYIHSDGNICPEEGDTTYEIQFMAYIPDFELGWQTFNVEFTTDRVSVEIREIATDPIYPDGVVEWEVYSR